MKLQGTCWIAVQDIGGFTPLSESLARKGKTGTESLTAILRRFFNQAEVEISAHNGRIFKLAGDAFFALFPGTIDSTEVDRLGKKLLALPALKAAGLKTRFVAVKGEVAGEWFELSPGIEDLALTGPAIYTLSSFEEQTPAGSVRTVEIGRDNLIVSLPRPPAPGSRFTFRPAHRPMYIIFLHIPLDFKVLGDVSRYIKTGWPGLYLLKWIPMARNFNGLLVSGFPVSTGKEAELIMDFYYALKQRFPALKFKMGVSSGMVYAGEMGGRKFREFAVIGDRVNVAARMAEIAPEKSMYFSGELGRLIKGKFRFTPKGATRLKGKMDPIELCQPEERILDLFEDSLFPHKLAGRGKTLDRMMAHIRDGRSCCVVGEAGMGKSRTLYEIMRRLGRGNIAKIGMTPISPPLTFIRELSRHFPAGDFADLNHYLDGKIKLPRTRAAELVAAMLRSQPDLVVMVEDLHWIDNASLALLSELDSLPILLIASARPEAESKIAALGFCAVPLAPLDRPALKCLAQDILGAVPVPELMGFLAEKSGGNPFYLEQIIYDLNERNLIPVRGGAARLDIKTDTLPFGIHAIILSRFSRLPVPVQRTMEIAACIGREFEPGILKKIDHQGMFHLRRGISEGVLTQSGGIYLFKHALFREAILSSMLEATRREYESAVGRVFIDENKPAYEIAHHLTAAGAIDAAAYYWVIAFKEMHDRGLESELTGMIQRLADNPNERVKPLANLLNAYYLTNASDYYDAEIIFKQLSNEPELKKPALFGLANLYDLSARYDQMAKTLTALGKYAMTLGERIDYLELKGICFDMLGDDRNALPCYRQTYALTRRHDLAMSLISSLHNIGWIYLKQRKYRPARRYFEQALLHVKEGDFYSEGTILTRLGQIANVEGNLRGGRDYLIRSQRNFQKVSFPYWERIALFALIENYILSGDKAGAYRCVVREHELAKMMNRMSLKAAFHLYYQEFDKFRAMVRGREKEHYQLNYIYLYALGKPEAAEAFLAENRLKITAPSAEQVKNKLSPLDQALLYVKYVLPRRPRSVNSTAKGRNSGPRRN